MHSELMSTASPVPIERRLILLVRALSLTEAHLGHQSRCVLVVRGLSLRFYLHPRSSLVEDHSARQF